VNGSWVFAMIDNYTSSTGPTPGSSQINTFNGHSAILTDNPDGIAFWLQATTSPTATAGTVVTLNDTAPASTAHHMSMVEVMPLFIAPATVTTTSVTNITATGATGSGTVEDDGNSTITERGVCWSTSANPTTANSKATAAGTTGSFTANITGLSDGTVYHVRAYAINSAGTTYGNDVTFQNYHAGSFGYIKA